MIGLLFFIGWLVEDVLGFFYVGSTDVLPEPLSKDKEEFYLELLEDGDLHAKDVLIEHNLRLVVFLAK